ncbi:MAG: ABC transporter ATP-binding protein [Pontiella sp.]
MNFIKKSLMGNLKIYVPYLQYLYAVKKPFIGGLIAAVIYGVAGGFGLPVMLKYVIPLLFTDPRPEIMVMVLYVSAFPLAMTVRAISGFMNTYLISFCGMRVLLQLQSDVLEKLQQLPMSFYHKNTVGDLMARVLGDCASLQQVLTKVANDLIKQPVTMLSAIVALIYLAFQEKNGLFLIMFIATVPLIILPLRIFGKKILKRAKQVQAQSGDISKLVSENLNAVREIRAFNLQDREMNRFRSALDNFCYLSMKVVKYGQIIRPTIEIIGVFCVSGALVYMLQHNIEAVAVAMLAALYMAYEPIKKFGEIHMSLKRGEAALQRIEYIMNESNEVPEPENPTALGSIKGRIEFEGVHFRYLEEWVLQDINLTIEPGTSVALVGPSGAGKTTVADLIPRFYDVEKGGVKIDGMDVRTVSKQELRSVISVVSQDTFLFNETVLNNIRVGNPNATDEQVYEAARHAYAHDFILELDNGYETMVGERGTRLSGGQKQRIAIARAFLKQSPILILDEATSALDSESEEKIQTALEELIQNKTVIIIAHRFSTIRNADQIAVFNEGRIAGFGPHDELYANNTIYKKLYDRQFSGD